MNEVPANNLLALAVGGKNNKVLCSGTNFSATLGIFRVFCEEGFFINKTSFNGR